MNKYFIDYIDSSLKKPAPRAATFWRGWASQTDLPLQDRDGIVQSFSDYVYTQTSHQETAQSAIENVGQSLETFWSLIDEFLQ